MFNKWQVTAIIFAIIYIISCYLLLPLASLSLRQDPPLPMKITYDEQYMTVEEKIRNSANRDHFVVGDLAIFSFNITNTYNQTVTFNYNSSVRFLDYGSAKNFDLGYLQSKNITEKLLVSSEGNNGFRFQLVENIGNARFHYNFTHILPAVSLSDELAIYVNKSTFLLAMIIGIPAIVYGVKNFKELGEKKKSEIKETEK